MIFQCVPVAREEAERLVPVLRDAEESDERIRSAMRDPACVTYEALVDGNLVGAAVVSWQEHASSEILYIAVVASERGKGYGQRIIAALQAELCAHGHVLLVGTGNCSLENIAFYQKCGFRMFTVRRDRFTYIQPPLQEHGITLRDMIVFSYELP
jgi:GNAT superfamily N-acetyltransferase